MSLLRNLFKGLGGSGQGQKQQQQLSANGQDPMFNEDYAEFVNNEYTTRQSERRFFELQWRLNTEFLNGNQYLDINPMTMTLEDIPKLWGWQEREVFNQLATIVETRIAKMSRQKPILKTRPASSDDSDISSAKITSMLLGSTWHDQIMDEQYEDFVSWLELTGTVLIKQVWSKNKGRVIFRGDPQQLMGGAQPGQQPMQQAEPGARQEVSPEVLNEPALAQSEGQSLPAEGGQPQQQPQFMEIREGDLDTIVVPSHEFFPDSCYRQGLRACRSVIHAKAFHLDEIEEMWGQRVEPEEVDVMTLQRSSSGMGGLGYGFGGVRSTSTTLKNHAVVKEFYERPCQKYPQGRFIVVAGKTTLYAGALPYQNGRDGEPDFPFVRCISIDSPGCFWGKSIIERCIPIQRRYNAFRNRKAEYLNMVAIGQWTAPIGSLEEGTELNNAPGNIIYYRATTQGFKPEPVAWPNLPASFETEEQTLMAEFTSVSGVSELSRYAEAPAGVKSGVALGIANEQDNTRIATSVARIANCMVDVGQRWIRLYRQFAQGPRVLRFVGGNREADVRNWEKSDLRSDDVFIENMAALAESPSQRRQMVFDLLNSGLFARPEMSNLTEEGRQKVFQLLEFGHWETAYEDDMFLHKSRARRENANFMQGQPSQVMDFDDHMLHIHEHNRQRMQAEWDELLRTPTGMIANELIMAHIAEHIQLALEAMPKEPVQPEGKPGGPPAKGGESK